MHPGKGFGMSSYLKDMVCYIGQSQVFDEAEDTLSRLCGVVVSDKQIERLCHAYGGSLEDLPLELKEQKEEDAIYYAMADGSMVLTREKDESGKCKWGEMKLGRVFRAADNMALGAQKEARHWIRSSQYVAHFGDCDAFFDKFEGLLDPIENFIFIADGATWIWDRVSAFYPKAVQILDFFHALQHLWTLVLLCWELNFENETSRQIWIEQQKDLLLQGQVEAVCEHINALKVKGEKAQEEQTKLVQYYQNNIERMRYGDFQAKGYLIGSGPIESAHRNVIQKRLKLSGQRWTRPGAQQVVNLRVAYKSDQWDRVRKMTKIRA